MGEYNQPEGWSLPEKLAKKLGKVMDKKPRADPMVNLIEILKYSAQAIADVEPEPVDWADWMTYLLELLQAEAIRDFKQDQFEDTLLRLKSSLSARIERKKW